MTPVEFYDACERFDWFYKMSDDPRVYTAGSNAKFALLRHALTGSVNRAIWDAWEAYIYSGESFGKVKAPKPERPLES